MSATSSLRGSTQSKLIQAVVDKGVMDTADSAAAAAACHPRSTACRIERTCRKSLNTCSNVTG